MNLFGVRRGFKAQQTLGCDLQVLFRFRYEEVQHFPGNVIIFRQIVGEVAFGCQRRVLSLYASGRGQIFCRRGRRGRRASKRKCIAVFESRNIISGFAAVGTDLQQVKFKNGDRVRQELGKRAVGVGTQLRLAGVLKDVRQSPGNVREERKSPAACGFGEGMRGIVKAGEVVARWTADGRSLYVYRPAALPLRVDLVEVETGRRSPWRTFMPPDPAGVPFIGPVAISPDGSAYAYSYRRQLAELSLATGLR